MLLKIVVLAALVGIIAESKVLHRRDTDSAVDSAATSATTDPILEAVNKEVKQLESVKPANHEQAKAIKSAILDGLKDLNEKVSKMTSKPKRSTEGDEDKAGCCG